MATEAQCCCTMRGLPQGAHSQHGCWEAHSLLGPCHQGIPAGALDAGQQELWVTLGAAGSHFIMVELSKARTLQPILFWMLRLHKVQPQGSLENALWKRPCLCRETVSIVTSVAYEMPVKLSLLTDNAMLKTFPRKTSKFLPQIIMPLSHTTTFWILGLVNHAEVAEESSSLE